MKSYQNACKQSYLSANTCLRRDSASQLTKTRKSDTAFVACISDDDGAYEMNTARLLMKHGPIGRQPVSSLKTERKSAKTVETACRTPRESNIPPRFHVVYALRASWRARRCIH